MPRFPAKGSSNLVMNENQWLNYLHQLAIVSWMPRQPLPGAKPSELFYHEAPKKESLISQLRTRDDADDTATSALHRPEPAGASAKPPEGAGSSHETESISFQKGTGATDNADGPIGADPMDAVADKAKINRVPERLQLAFIRQQGNRPLIVSHFGEYGDAEQAFLPLCQSMLGFVGFSEPLVSMPFVWPLAGMPPACREQEFVEVFRALLGGARLGCRLGQGCWWFGGLSELVADSDRLLILTLYLPCSLTDVMNKAEEKQAVLYRLLQLNHKARTE